MLESSESLAQTRLKWKKIKYLPSLVMIYRRQELMDKPQFNFTPPNVFALSMDIPIFSSGSRRAQVQQAQIELEKVKTTKHSVEQGLTLQYEQLKKVLRYFLYKRRPYYLFWSVVILMLFTFFLVGSVKPKIVFFPDNEPQSFSVYVNLPVETHQNVTDSVTKIVEQKIVKVLGENNPIVESVISNIALGAGEGFFDRSTVSNKGKVTVNFVESKYRHGISTGEREDMDEASGFLTKAMLISLGLIFFILIAQFNSFSKSIIILSEIIFSIIGVLLGIMIFGMPIPVALTGLGIVARNGILIVEFTDVLKARGLKTREAIVQAGKIRITPVVLTATAAILGLIPLAVGMNIDFIKLFSELNPHIRFGGDIVMFWGPLSWTIIFGLSFATFLTLILVPVMYYMAYAMRIKIKRRKSLRM